MWEPPKISLMPLKYPQVSENKLKSLKVAKWRMNEELLRMMKDEGWGFQAVEGFWGQTDDWTDISECIALNIEENVGFFNQFGTYNTI